MMIVVLGVGGEEVELLDSYIDVHFRFTTLRVIS